MLVRCFGTMADGNTFGALAPEQWAYGYRLTDLGSSGHGNSDHTSLSLERPA